MYTKLFASILDSSLWSQAAYVCKLFVTMLAMADREGYVFASRVGLIRRAVLTDVETDTALAILEAPDPESSDLLRNPENQGRRVEQVSGGWRILNYCYYRELRDEDERREQNRQAQQRYRVKRRADGNQTSAGVSIRQHPSAPVGPSKPAESESESESYKNPSLPSTGDPPTGGNPPRARKKTGSFIPPTADEVRAYAGEVGANLTDPAEFHAYWTGEDWKNSKGRKIRDWRKTFRSRERDLEHRPVRRPRFGWEINPDVRVGKGSPDEPEDDGTIELETEEEATFAREEVLKGRPREDIRQEILARR